VSLSNLVRASQTPLLYANLVVAAGAGVYLAATGYVTTVWPFIVGLLFSPIVFPLLLTPVGLFAGMAHLLSQAKPGVARFLNILSVGTLVTVMAGVCVLVLRLVYDVATVQPIAAVYGVAIALSAWALLALKDRQNLFFTGMLWMTQITAIVIAYFMMTLQWDAATTFWSFWIAMVALVLLQTAYEAMFIKPQQPPQEPPAVPPAA